jgi:aspartate carbamoyltransferase catalytic subunit
MMTLNHLLSVKDLPAEECARLFDRAALFANTPAPSSLAGRLVATLFFENSTRTRTSFELAAQRLGAEVLSFSVSTSSTAKGESLADTAQTLDAMRPDVVVVRHGSSGAAQYLSQKIKARVVNAGDGWHEHPTQALLDAFTLRQHWGSLEGKHITIVGDLLHSRVARSNLLLLPKLGARVRVAGPPSLCPRELRSLGAEEVFHTLRPALEGADAVMALRLQRERMGRVYLSSEGEYFARFGLSEERLSWANPGAVVLHPGPMNRGVEIGGSLADSPRSLILQQVASGVWVRMAVLEAVLAS